MNKEQRIERDGVRLSKAIGFAGAAWESISTYDRYAATDVHAALAHLRSAIQKLHCTEAATLIRNEQ